MSSTHVLLGINIDVDKLLSVQIDAGHLKLTLSTILSALSTQAATNAASDARAAAMEAQLRDQSERLDASEAAAETAQRQLDEHKDRIEQLERQQAANANANDREENSRPTSAHSAVPSFAATAAAKDSEAFQISTASRLAELERLQSALRLALEAAKEASETAKRDAREAKDTAAATAAATAVSAAAAAKPAAARTPSTSSSNSNASAASASASAASAAARDVDSLRDALAVLQKNIEATNARLAKQEDTMRAFAARPAASGNGNSNGTTSSSGNDSGNGNNGNANNRSSSVSRSSSSPDLVVLRQQQDITSRQLSDALERLEAMQQAMEELRSQQQQQQKKKNNNNGATGNNNNNNNNTNNNHNNHNNSTNDPSSTTRSEVENVSRRLRATEGDVSSLQSEIRGLQAALGRAKRDIDSLHSNSGGDHNNNHNNNNNSNPSPPPPFSSGSNNTTASASGDLSDLRKFVENQLELLHRGHRSTRADILDLGEGLRLLQGKVTEALKVSQGAKEAIENVQKESKDREAVLQAKIASGLQQGRSYTDGQIADVLSRLSDLDGGMNKNIRMELKKFEKDILVFLQNAGSGMGAHDHNHGGGDAAAGKIHFRCLSCDQAVTNLQGPSSLLYARSVAAANALAAAPGNSNATSMSIERGKELYINGRDGNVYKGRDPTLVTISPPTQGAQASHFQVRYPQNGMATTNARGTTIVDQKTINSAYAPHLMNSGGSARRPGSAAEPHTPNRSNRDELPPTRPATRGSTRSTVTSSRTQTPTREQQNLQLHGGF